jgi:hypothetical protein
MTQKAEPPEQSKPCSSWPGLSAPLIFDRSPYPAHSCNSLQIIAGNSFYLCELGHSLRSPDSFIAHSS